VVAGLKSEPIAWADKREVAWGIVSSGGIVALIGARGNGKTQIGVDLIRRSSLEGNRAAYLKAMDFFMDIRSTFARDAVKTEERVIEEFSTPRLLVIDNLDRRGSSEWEDRLLTHLIDKRYDRTVGTILIANLSEADFAAHIGADIADRIRDGGGLIVADWPGFRGELPG